MHGEGVVPHELQFVCQFEKAPTVALRDAPSLLRLGKVFPLTGSLLLGVDDVAADVEAVVVFHGFV